MIWVLLSCSDGDSEPVDSELANNCPASSLLTCVYWRVEEMNAVGGASVFASRGDETPLQGLAGDDGCVELPLEAGTWTVWASSPMGDCTNESDEPQVEVAECETTDHIIALMDWCVDG